MKLPNDLIKATDYSRAKDREIREFEYRNGKYIHKYVLGGEHELTPQEIIDCLNAISTIDCDLQTAYAFIQGKKDKIADLEAKLAESEKSKESYRLQNDEHHLQLCQFYSRLGVEAFGADIHEKALETLMIMKEELEEKNGVERALSACNRQNDEFADMIKKLVSEKEELKQQLAEKEKENDELQDKLHSYYEEIMNKGTCGLCEYVRTDYKISFAVEQLEKVKETVESVLDNALKNSSLNQSYYDRLLDEIDNQIKQLKEMK